MIATPLFGAYDAYIQVVLDHRDRRYKCSTKPWDRSLSQGIKEIVASFGVRSSSQQGASTQDQVQLPLRFTMAKKKGPPYEDDPECQYVVIANPWPGNRSGAQRTKIYFNWVSAWLSFMFEPREKPEELYYVNTVGIFGTVESLHFEYTWRSCL